MQSIRLIVLLAGLASALPAATPYRFLLVAGSQWRDEASVLIDRPGEFQIAAALLKTWALPFDILRLDQQLLDRYHLLDRDGSPRYGTILWDADDVKGRDLGLLAELNAMGVSIVVLGDTVRRPEVARLAGLRYVSPYKALDEGSFDRSHFITRALAGREKEMLRGVSYSYEGSKVVPETAKVIGRRGAAPFLTVVEQPGRGRVVWLGFDRQGGQMETQIARDLLKRALVWAQGYAVYAEYERSVILFADDWGTSDKTYLPYWRYRTPTEEEIRQGLIAPLQRRGAVMDLNVNTGFVDRKTRGVVRPWTQRVVDELDGKTAQDYASTKRGIDAGIAAGVFQIESHGWTHMLPDLESAPGPFWDAPMDGVGSLDWYNEFGDALRNADIPAATQRLHLRRAIECLREDFGVTPHVLRPAGSLYSKSPANHTALIAAGLGFGLAVWDSPVYLAHDLVLSLESVSRRKAWNYRQAMQPADVPWSVDAPVWVGFHDRDLALDPGSVARLLDGLGSGVRFMTGAEYSAYLHSLVSKAPGDGLAFAVESDERYCDWFASHPSRWTVHLADETRRRLPGNPPEKQTIELKKGTGSKDLWNGTANGKTGSAASR
jgi:hypothetical protein